MQAVETREEELASAQGVDWNVAVFAGKVVVRSRSMSGILRRAISSVTDPMSLVEAIQGPNKEILLRALVDSSDLAQAILTAMRSGRPQAGDPSLQSSGSDKQILDKLRDALEHNRAAFMDALHENQGLIREWAGEHKDLMGIFLKGDIHIAVDSLYSVDLTTRRDGAGVLRMDFGDEQLAVQFQASRLQAFQEAKKLIDELIGGVAPAAPVAEVPVPATKACPMCAEEVKAAAKICRFCGHKFEG
ncbi:MAG TPA: zinc ribbon domain-containing protein [Actinomycetota bacterium]|nr:zinc ribbon domain-containing protein [Actinomycetota bacterium]